MEPSRINGVSIKFASNPNVKWCANWILARTNVLVQRQIHVCPLHREEERFCNDSIRIPPRLNKRSFYQYWIWFPPGKYRWTERWFCLEIRSRFLEFSIRSTCQENRSLSLSIEYSRNLGLTWQLFHYYVFAINESTLIHRDLFDEMHEDAMLIRFVFLDSLPSCWALEQVKPLVDGPPWHRFDRSWSVARPWFEMWSMLDSINSIRSIPISSSRWVMLTSIPPIWSMPRRIDPILLPMRSSRMIYSSLILFFTSNLPWSLCQWIVVGVSQRYVDRNWSHWNRCGHHLLIQLRPYVAIDWLWRASFPLWYTTISTLICSFVEINSVFVRVRNRSKNRNQYQLDELHT